MAVEAAPHCHRVVAVDVSRAMLDVASAKATSLALANIELVQAGFLTYEHTGEAPAFVYSRNALHHLPDFWKAIALERVSQLLRPGDIFLLRDLVFSFEPSEAEDALEAWLEGAPERSDEGWARSELETHIQAEHSTFTWLLEPILERAGLEILQVNHAASRIYSAYVLSSAS